MSDVHVFGMSMQTVLIADIAVDVPHGMTVVIPADKAARSIDLHRLINQRVLFWLNQGPQTHAMTPVAPQPMAPGPFAQSVMEAEHLREENRLLAEQNRMLRQAIDSQGGKLDTILGVLGSIQAPSGSGPGPSQTGKSAPPLVVSADVPTYIPSEIKPKNVESHVEVQSTTSEGSNVADAGEALRKLRRGAR